MPYRPAEESLSSDPRNSDSKTRTRVFLALMAFQLILLLSFPIGVLGVGCAPSETGEDLGALTDLAVKLMSAKRFDEALPVQERIAILDPEDAQIRIELGFNYLSHQDRPVDAVRVMLEAVELEPSARYLTFLAQAQIGGGDQSGAEKTLQRAIATDETYPHSYVVLERLLRESGRSQEAEYLIEQARGHGVDASAFPEPGV